jgi:hypothetical protein
VTKKDEVLDSLKDCDDNGGYSPNDFYNAIKN